MPGAFIVICVLNLVNSTCSAVISIQDQNSRSLERQRRLNAYPQMSSHIVIWKGSNARGRTADDRHRGPRAQAGYTRLLGAYRSPLSLPPVSFLSMSIDRIRASKLSKLLEAFVSGQRPLIPRTSALFFEAIVAQPDAATCIERVTQQQELESNTEERRSEMTRIQTVSGHRPANAAITHLATMTMTIHVVLEITTSLL